MELITHDLKEPRLRYPGRKGIYPFITDFDDMYRRLDVPPVLANEMDLSTEEGQARFNALVYTRHNGDVFSNVPSCPCHATSGGDRIGDLCPVCNHICLPVTEQAIQPIVWVKCPDKVPKFINLNIYRLLKLRFIKSGFSAIDWLLDPKYCPPKLDCMEELMLRELGFARGLKSFYENFDDIIEAICLNQRQIQGPKGKVTVNLIPAGKGKQTLNFIRKVRHLVFCDYLPFPSKIGFIVEDLGDRTFVDPKMGPALDALISIANAGKVGRSGQSDIESRVARAINRLVVFYSDNERQKIFDKKGIFRKLTYGVSPHWTFRTVITSLHKPHDHESLEMPWGAAVLTFKLHITNKLLKENYTPNEINTLIYDNTLRTHHKLEKIFDQLIAESPRGRGIPCAFTRFPSLKRGSTQRFYIDHIKRDPTSLSTSISPICLKAPNADFDGDYMTGQLALDNEIAAAFDRLAPYTGIMDLRRPFRVSDHAQIPAPVMSTINHRIEIADLEAVEYDEDED